MKKLLQLPVIITIITASFSTFAHAQTCTITNTGPGSTNTCETTSDFTCQVTNENNFTITNNNTQEVTSGTATGTSGSATNSSGTVIGVTLANEGCVIASVTPPPDPTPTPTPTPTPVPTAAPVTPVATTLPNTGTNNGMAIIGILAAGLGLTALASRFGVAAYRRIKQ